MHLVEETCAATLKHASQLLKTAKCQTPKLDARLLLQAALGAEHSALISGLNDTIGDGVRGRYLEMIKQRIAGQSVHRIVGFREFHGHRIELSQATLEPRPDTECLVNCVIENAGRYGPKMTFADIGTGSGAIVISLLARFPEAKAIATDISVEALDMASINARNSGVADRVQFIEADYMNGIEGPFDFIVSNPPYIRTEDIHDLEREVKHCDPLIALDGGIDGLEAYRHLLKDGDNVLVPGGDLYLEIGSDQAASLRALAEQYNWQIEGPALDLAGLPRVMVFGNA